MIYVLYWRLFLHLLTPFFHYINNDFVKQTNKKKKTHRSTSVSRRQRQRLSSGKNCRETVTTPAVPCLGDGGFVGQGGHTEAGPGAVIDDMLEKRRKVLLICTIVGRTTREAERESEREKEQEKAWLELSQPDDRAAAEKLCVCV